MRIKAMWTVGSHYSEKSYYWVFTTDDTSYTLAYGGKIDSLLADQSKQMDIDRDKVKIGFREGDTIFSKWIAEPVEVFTDRSVTLTKDGKIEQPKGQEWQNPDKSKDVEFMSETEINNIARQVLLAGLGKIPDVGGIIAGILGFIWKEIKPEIGDLIAASEQRMKSWVRGRIAEYDREFLKNKLSGLHRNLDEYVNAINPEERRRWLDVCLAQFNDAQGFFTKSNYTLGTLGMAVDVATMHLALLRERVVYCKEIFGDETVNIASFQRKLKEGIAEYQKFVLEVAIPAEVSWRRGQIEIDDIDSWKGHWITLYDRGALQVYLFAKDPSRRVDGDPTVLREYYLRQATGSYAMALEANVADAARMWALLDPEAAGSQPIAVDRIMWVGPCTGLIYKYGNEHGASQTVKRECRGMLKKIVVREYNQIDYLEFVFADHPCSGIGNKGGGIEHEVDIPDGKFIVRVDTWWDWELVGIQFFFSDGSSTPKFGDRTGTGHHKQSASYPGHRLSGIRIEGGPSAGIGNAITFGFSPLPDYYDVKD
jgi:hypothetical protein